MNQDFETSWHIVHEIIVFTLAPACIALFIYACYMVLK